MIFKKRLIDQRVIKMVMRINCNKYKIQKKPYHLLEIPFHGHLASGRTYTQTHILCYAHVSQRTIQITFPDENLIGYGPSADGYDKIVITECVSDAL